jgi:predicted aminopeptidase
VSNAVGNRNACIFSFGCCDDRDVRRGRLHEHFLLRTILVEALIDDPSIPGTLRARMASASAIRQFAIDELALPDNNSYRSYVNVGRDAVTWAIFAAPEFSLTPRTWCFPVFGCVPYRGYFSKRSAIETVVALQRQGLDVYDTDAG